MAILIKMARKGNTGFVKIYSKEIKIKKGNYNGRKVDFCNNDKRGNVKIFFKQNS